MSFKVVQTDWYNPPLSDPSVERAVLEPVGAELVQAHCRTREEILAATAEADAVLHHNVRIDAGVIANMARCRVIVHYGVGVDQIDVAAATARGIYVANVPTYGTDEVSTHAMALLLACARRLLPAHRLVEAGTWSGVAATLGHVPRTEGATLGLVGFGAIARAVARKAQGFAMRVLACDPFVDAAEMARAGAEAAPLERLMAEADFVSVHVPLTAATAGLINRELIGRMKPTAHLINTARGGVIDQQALYEALRDGRIAGAGLDVLADEPPGAAEPLLALPNVLATAHTGFYSVASVHDMQRGAAEQAAAALRGEVPPNTLNPEAAKNQPR